MLYSSTTTAENGNNLIIELYTITSIKKICEYQLLSESLQEKKCKNMCIAHIMGRYITKYIIQKFTRIDMPRGREFWLQLQLQHHFTLTFKYSVGSLQLI